MYPEPHIERDPIAFRRWFIAGLVYVVLFWAVVLAMAFIDFTASATTARPSACDGYTAQECAAAVEAML